MNRTADPRLTEGDAGRPAVRGATDAFGGLRVETCDGALCIDASGTDPGLRLALQVADLTRFVSMGDGRVRRWAENMLDVVVAGAARIRYAGSPRVEQQVSGVARVLRLPGIII